MEASSNPRLKLTKKENQRRRDTSSTETMRPLSEPSRISMVLP